MLLTSISPVILALLDSIQELEEMLSQNYPGAGPERTVEVQRLPTAQACMSFHSDT